MLLFILGVNLHLTCDQSLQKELISSDSSSSKSTVLNPTYGDLRQYIAESCKLPPHIASSLIFIDSTQPDAYLSDHDSVKETFTHRGDVFALELSTPQQPATPQSQQQQQQSQPTQPMISLVAINVYPRVASTGAGGSRLAAYGLPFSLLINRDCSYAELCCKILDSQAKYFKDRNMLKYRVS